MADARTHAAQRTFCKTQISLCRAHLWAIHCLVQSGPSCGANRMVQFWSERQWAGETLIRSRIGASLGRLSLRKRRDAIVVGEISSGATPHHASHARLAI